VGEHGEECGLRLVRGSHVSLQKHRVHKSLLFSERVRTKSFQSRNNANLFRFSDFENSLRVMPNTGSSDIVSRIQVDCDSVLTIDASPVILLIR
jgi:hypothetical protein